MHAIERELIKVTGYKAKRKFSDREDYLKSLLNDVMKLTDDDFDNLTDEAAAWTNAAVDAHNSKNGTIPDFDEVEASEDDENEPEADEADDGEEASDDTESSDDDETDVSDSDSDEAEPDDAEEELSEDEPETDEPEDEPAPKPAKKKVVAKEKAAPKIPAKKEVAPKKETAPAKKKQSGFDEDVVLDKWGCMEGSKNARAMAMFERGATSKEVSEEVGGTYYNILKKAQLNGHKLEKDGAIIKVTHRDANKAPVKKKK